VIEPLTRWWRDRSVAAALARYPEADWDPAFADIAPIAGVEGTAAESLGRFWRLLDLLQGWG
jgi:hypothetical protein